MREESAGPRRWHAKYQQRLQEPVRQLAVNAAAATTPESLKLADRADVLGTYDR